MRKKNRDRELATFNQEAVQAGLTYADVQRMETQSSIGRIRAPRTEKSNGELVYMTVSARKKLKELKQEACKDV